MVVCVTVTVPVETAAAGSCDEETGEGRGGATTAFGNCCSVNWGTVVAVTTPLGIVAGKAPTKRKQFHNHLKSLSWKIPLLPTSLDWANHIEVKKMRQIKQWNSTNQTVLCSNYKYTKYWTVGSRRLRSLNTNRRLKMTQSVAIKHTQNIQEYNVNYLTLSINYWEG